MTRATLIRRLRALGDTTVPEGHLRTNKGITTYFFLHNKIEEVARFLLTVVDPDELNNGPTYDRTTVPVTLVYSSTDKERRVLLHFQNDFVSVAILRWPA